MPVAAETTCGRAARRPPARGAAPLRVEGARKRYGATTALAGVDLDVHAGEVVGLVGPNGSGKTTLLHAAAGLVGLDGGAIAVAGEPAGSPIARRSTALVPDDPAGFDELSVAEHVSLVHALWPPDPLAATRAALLLDAFGLGERRDLRLGALSRGLRRQASAVAALSLAPPLVLVDEATATLDPEAVVVLEEAVRALARSGCGVLLATQDLRFAGAACDQVVLLHRGRVVERGRPAELLDRHAAASLEDVLLAAVGDRLLRQRIRNAFGAL